MSTVLVIESCREQAIALQELVDEHIQEAMTLVDSVDAALAAIDAAVPEVILINALMPPQEEAELVGRLRALPKTSFVQTLIAPQLPPASAPRQGWSRFKIGAAPKPAQHDSSAFITELRTYLRLVRNQRVELAESHLAASQHQAAVDDVAARGQLVVSNQPAVFDQPPVSDWLTVSSQLTSADRLAAWIQLATDDEVVASNQLSAADRRSAVRVANLHRAQVIIDGLKASVVDLSLTGAQVLSSTLLVPGSLVQVVLESGQEMARCRAAIVWGAFEIAAQGIQYRAGLDFRDADFRFLERLCRGAA